jgi:quercetin dioxygenase-like cupin family protein
MNHYPAQNLNSPPSRDTWQYGNASTDTAAPRGWLVGHFIDSADGAQSTNQVEVKWGVHPAGDRRPEWTSNEYRTTLVMLVQGVFRVDLTGGSRILAEQGDYVLWGPGINHTWQALDDAVVITVRWPSTP